MPIQPMCWYFWTMLSTAQCMLILWFLTGGFYLGSLSCFPLGFSHAFEPTSNRDQRKTMVGEQVALYIIYIMLYIYNVMQ